MEEHEENRADQRDSNVKSAVANDGESKEPIAQNTLGLGKYDHGDQGRNQRYLGKAKGYEIRCTKLGNTDSKGNRCRNTVKQQESNQPNNTK